MTETLHRPEPPRQASDNDEQEASRSARILAPATLLCLASACAATLAFMWIASQGTQSALRRMDERVLLAMRSAHDIDDPLGPPWFEEAARDVTALGGIPVLALVTLALCTSLLLLKQRRSAVLILLLASSSVVASSLLKARYDRPRPELVPHRLRVFTQSFPSGHAMVSSATYLTATAILTRRQRQTAIRRFLLFSAMLLVAAIGVSRVYLGVHWPSDVLAGWTAGGILALCFWMVCGRLERRP